MKPDFEELDYGNTPMGEITLRRRTEPRLGVEVYEVKLGDEFLMSSLFTDGEVALARLALAACEAGPLDVAVGGLGLGYTARAVLDHVAVRSLLVVEAFSACGRMTRRARRSGRPSPGCFLQRRRMWSSSIVRCKTAKRGTRCTWRGE